MTRGKNQKNLVAWEAMMLRGLESRQYGCVAMREMKRRGAGSRRQSKPPTVKYDAGGNGVRRRGSSSIVVGVWVRGRSGKIE